VFFERIRERLGLIRIDSMRWTVSVVLKIGVKEITSRCQENEILEDLRICNLEKMG